jgi:hypothetical protein
MYRFLACLTLSLCMFVATSSKAEARCVRLIADPIRVSVRLATVPVRVVRAVVVNRAERVANRRHRLFHKGC